MKNTLSVTILLLTAILIVGSGKNNEPRVEKLSNGRYKLIINDTQMNAIIKFLYNYPSVKLVTKDEFIPDGEMELFKKGQMQYPYVCWGDLNKDGLLDICCLFVTKEKHGYYPEWWIVVFNGTKTGGYNPEIITNKIVCSFAPGLMYHKDKNYVEFFAYEKAAGEFHWDGNKFVVKNPTLMGD